MHPVPCGLIAAVHEPSSEDGAVGGSGNSEISTGSGRGAGGFSRIASMVRPGSDCIRPGGDDAGLCANSGGAAVKLNQIAAMALTHTMRENRMFITEPFRTTSRPAIALSRDQHREWHCSWLGAAAPTVRNGNVRAFWLIFLSSRKIAACAHLHNSDGSGDLS